MHPENFLLIQFRQIGDVILTTPIPKILGHHLPYSRIDVLTFTSNEPIWRHNPYISNLIAFDKQKGFWAFIKLLLQIRRNQYDAALDFQDTPRSTYCILASGAKYRVTWNTSSRRKAYNILVPRTEGYPVITKSNLLQPFIAVDSNASLFNPKPEVYFKDIETNRIKTVFRKYGIDDNDFIVTMAPTHRRKVRRWPFHFFMETAHFLIQRYNAKVILSFGPNEVDYIQNNLRAGGFTHPNLITDLFLNLLELAALMQKAKFHFGNDSAPQHLATAQNLPTFSIYGATSTTWSYPSTRNESAVKRLPCQPCNKLYCKFDDAIPCLREFTFEDIRPKLERFIQRIGLP
jgi:heptosyltransferase-2/heptosyltransferase-3